MYPFAPDSVLPMCLYGLVSWGSPDCSGWGMYTRVPHFRDWIQQKMDENY